MFPPSRLGLSFIQRRQQHVHALQSKSEAKLSRAFQPLPRPFREHRSEKRGTPSHRTDPAREAQQTLQDAVGQAHVWHTKHTPLTISSCPFMAPSRHRLELGFLRLLGNSHFPAGYMGFLSKTPQIVYGIPSFPGFKPPSLEGKKPNSPQLWQLLIQGKCL